MSTEVANQDQLSAPINGEHAVTRFLRLIRFSHTVFALPFALGSLIVAADGLPSLQILLLVLSCMVCARTAAMLFNRLADWSLDQRNPRTSSRHRLVSQRAAIAGLLLTTAGFLVSAAFINRLTFLLSPVALAIVLFYSVTKRFTSLTHFFLGLALAVAPVGAWIAVRGSIDLPPLVLAAAVLCWVAGFDVIYSTQDYDFDQREKLRSLVVRLGIERSLAFAQILHVFALIALIVFGVVARLGVFYFAAMPLIAVTLVFEHRSARKLDIAAINRAFFQSNAFVSGIFLLAVCVDWLA